MAKEIVDFPIETWRFPIVMLDLPEGTYLRSSTIQPICFPTGHCRPIRFCSAVCAGEALGGPARKPRAVGDPPGRQRHALGHPG